MHERVALLPAGAARVLGILTKATNSISIRLAHDCRPETGTKRPNRGREVDARLDDEGGSDLTVDRRLCGVFSGEIGCRSRC